MKNLYARLEQAHEKAEQFRAWIAFIESNKITELFDLGLELEDHWYNEWDDLKLRFRDLHDHRVLRKAIQSMMRDGYEVGGDPELFKRHDIYNKMAYASFPLKVFTETTSRCTVTFSLPLPMVFAVSSFRFQRSRKRHHDGWWGRMYLNDGRVTKQYRDREVAEIFSPEEATREQMFEALLNIVRQQEVSSLFTITGDSMIGAMIKAQSENLLLTQAYYPCYQFKQSRG